MTVTNVAIPERLSADQGPGLDQLTAEMTV
jgi:hypothetical protein